MNDNLVNNVKNKADMISGDMHKKMQSMTKDMLGSLSNLKGDDFDKKFLEMTIMHHRQVVEMAQLVKTNAAHEELKEKAAEMEKEQLHDIEQMQNWQNQWGYSE